MERRLTRLVTEAIVRKATQFITAANMDWWWQALESQEPELTGWVWHQADCIQQPLQAGSPSPSPYDTTRSTQWILLTTFLSMRLGHDRLWRRTMQTSGLRRLDPDASQCQPFTLDRRAHYFRSPEDRLVTRTTMAWASSLFRSNYLTCKLTEVEPTLARHIVCEVEQVAVVLKRMRYCEKAIAMLESNMAHTVLVAAEAIRAGHFRFWKGTALEPVLCKLDPSFA
ncbi:hypothetical protein ACERK3_15685 [Phycisphaerales bacterium AB-hyl4]|uniref:Uncharacterized protein n=1 Tax=Natronomicrosphaera hydrolytica TaxID=3242702 RepID=A0ABV4U809_9BACT